MANGSLREKAYAHVNVQNIRAEATSPARRDVDSHTPPSRCGVGMTVERRESQIRIVTIDPCGPAAYSGQLALGDILEEIDGTNLSELEADAAEDLLEGTEGTLVKVWVSHPNSASSFVVWMLRQEADWHDSMPNNMSLGILAEATAQDTDFWEVTAISKGGGAWLSSFAWQSDGVPDDATSLKLGDKIESVNGTKKMGSVAEIKEAFTEAPFSRASVNVVRKGSPCTPLKVQVIRTPFLSGVRLDRCAHYLNSLRRAMTAHRTQSGLSPQQPSPSQRPRFQNSTRSTKKLQTEAIVMNRATPVNRNREQDGTLDDQEVDGIDQGDVLLNLLAEWDKLQELTKSTIRAFEHQSRTQSADSSIASGGRNAARSLNDLHSCEGGQGEHGDTHARHSLNSASPASDRQRQRKLRILEPEEETGEANSLRSEKQEASLEEVVRLLDESLFASLADTSINNSGFDPAHEGEGEGPDLVREPFANLQEPHRARDDGGRRTRTEEGQQHAAPGGLREWMADFIASRGGGVRQQGGGLLRGRHGKAGAESTGGGGTRMGFREAAAQLEEDGEGGGGEGTAPPRRESRRLGGAEERLVEAAGGGQQGRAEEGVCRARAGSTVQASRLLPPLCNPDLHRTPPARQMQPRARQTSAEEAHGRLGRGSLCGTREGDGAAEVSSVTSWTTWSL